MSMHEAFNRSGFSQFINSPAGRIFRLAAGVGFLVVGYVYREHSAGLPSALNHQSTHRHPTRCQAHFGVRRFRYFGVIFAILLP